MKIKNKILIPLVFCLFPILGHLQNVAKSVDSEIKCEVELVQLITGAGDPGKLFDEQGISGDPANGTGGDPITVWFPGANADLYPAEAYVDLGGQKQLTRIFLRDVKSSGLFRVYSGSPGNWNPVASVNDNLFNHKTWKEHELDVITRYLKFQMYSKKSFASEIVVYGLCDEDVDLIAPSQITDLNISSTGIDSISLNWTAPGDDENVGTATSYDLRYSETPIDASNFFSADQWPTVMPQTAGSQESLTVTGLDCNSEAYYFAIIASDEEGNAAPISNVSNGIMEICNTTDVFILLEFDDALSSLPEIQIAPLRYNKDFAYSLSLDDGSPWEYYNVYPVLKGGMNSGYVSQDEPSVYESGKFYTDGCGNDIPFRAGLSINAEKIKTYQQENHMSWDNLLEMFNDEWDIYNHSYTHCAFEDCNYSLEVTQNTDTLAHYLDYVTNQFVVPTNDNENYVPPAFNNGMTALYTQNYGAVNEYSSQVQVSDVPDLNDFIMLRNNMQNEDVPLGEDIDLVASESTNGQQQWFSEYVHRVGVNAVPNGEPPYTHVSTSDFRAYMEHIENSYGKDGDDRVWVASMQTVYEYLVIRSTASFTTYMISNNQVGVYLDLSNVPQGLRHRALSFTVNSDPSFSASVTGASMTNNGVDLVNIDW